MRRFPQHHLGRFRQTRLDRAREPPERGLLQPNTYYEDLPLPGRLFGADSPHISASCTGEAFEKLQRGLREDDLVLSTSSSTTAFVASDESFSYLQHKGTLQIPESDYVEELGNLSDSSRTQIRSARMSVSPAFLMKEPHSLNIDALLGALNLIGKQGGGCRVYRIVILTRISHGQQRDNDRYKIDMLSSDPGLASTDDMYLYREYSYRDDGRHETWKAFVPRARVHTASEPLPALMSSYPASISRYRSLELEEQALPGASSGLEPSHQHSLAARLEASAESLDFFGAGMEGGLSDYTVAGAEDAQTRSDSLLISPVHYSYTGRMDDAAFSIFDQCGGFGHSAEHSGHGTTPPATFTAGNSSMNGNAAGDHDLPIPTSSHCPPLPQPPLRQFNISIPLPATSNGMAPQSVSQTTQSSTAEVLRNVGTDPVIVALHSTSAPFDTISREAQYAFDPTNQVPTAPAQQTRPASRPVASASPQLQHASSYTIAPASYIAQTMLPPYHGPMVPPQARDTPSGYGGTVPSSALPAQQIYAQAAPQHSSMPPLSYGPLFQAPSMIMQPPQGFTLPNVPLTFMPPATMHTSQTGARQSTPPAPVPPLTAEHRQVLALPHRKITGENVLRLARTMKTEHVMLHVNRLRVADGEEPSKLTVFTKRISNAIIARAKAQGRAESVVRHEFNQERTSNGIKVNVGAAKKVANAVSTTPGASGALIPAPTISSAPQIPPASSAPDTTSSLPTSILATQSSIMSPTAADAGLVLPDTSPSPDLVGPPTIAAVTTTETSSTLRPLTAGDKRKRSDSGISVADEDVFGRNEHGITKKRDSGTG